MSEQLERGLETLRGEIDNKVKAFFSSCVRCGICAEACLFYTETSDPRYTPIYKTEPLRKLWENEYSFWGKLKSALGMSQAMTEADLADWEELVYDGCSMCGRCSMVCPVGVDISGIIFKVKHGLSQAGFSPEGLVGATQRAVDIGSPMGITLTTVQAMIKHVEADTGLKVPMDVEGADYMALLSSNEIALYPEYLESLVKIF
ncbi:MAG: (Fe-S)-binding protein, partial [Gammaproteobacteria bacterium]